MNHEEKKQTRRAILIMALAPIIAIVSIWVCSWLYYTLPKWAHVPSVATAIFMMIVSAIILVLGASELPTNTPNP
jgi:amino acid permease